MPMRSMASVPERLHAVEHALGGRARASRRRCGRRRGTAPGRRSRGDRVVGDHHDRLAEVVDGVAHEAEDLGAACGCRGCRSARRRRSDLGPAGQRPGDGHALLLAAGQLARPVLQPVAQADRVDDRVEPLLVGLAAGEVHRQRDVLRRGERRAPG